MAIIQSRQNIIKLRRERERDKKRNVPNWCIRRIYYYYYFYYHYHYHYHYYYHHYYYYDKW